MKLDELVPDEGFIGQYLAYVRGRVIGAPEIHLFCGIATASALIAPAVWFELGDQRWYPNIWSVCVARSGVGKSTPLRVALRLVSEVLEDALLPFDWSRESLLESIRDRPYGLMDVDEFGGFLTRARRDYNSGLKQDLTRIWDSPVEMIRRTKKAGDVTIRSPAITVLGACPIDELGAFAESGDLRQGFLSRFIFVPQTSSAGYVGRPPADNGQRDYLISLARELVRLRADTGPARIADGVWSQWEDYDRASRTKAEKSIPEMSGFYARRGIYTLKLGLLFSACHALDSPADPRTLDGGELHRAHLIMEEVTEAVNEIVSGEIGLNAQQKLWRSVWDKGKELAGANRGEIPRWRWLRAVGGRLKRKEFDELIDGWIEARRIAANTEKTAGAAGRPPVTYRLLTDTPQPERPLPEPAESEVP